jgi:uncharacterized protein
VTTVRESNFFNDANKRYDAHNKARKITRHIVLMACVAIFAVCIFSYVYIYNIVRNASGGSTTTTMVAATNTEVAASGSSGSTNNSGSTANSTLTSNTTSTDTDDTAAVKYYGTVYTNEKTGYSVIYEDDAALLTESEAEQLIEVMKPITAYGGVAFKTITKNSYSSTSSYASSYYASKFGYDSGTVFLIDMAKRNIYIHSNGAIYNTITNSYADVITDNVYRYASKSDYFTCAATAFQQEYTLLAGRRISQPMKYISNALLALVIAILINYIIVRTVSRKHAASQSELVSGIFVNNALNNSRVVLVRQTKTYAPRSSDSGGGGGGGHSGGGGGFSGGGGGGHSSGGGGGHSF